MHKTHQKQSLLASSSMRNRHLISTQAVPQKVSFKSSRGIRSRTKNMTVWSSKMGLESRDALSRGSYVGSLQRAMSPNASIFSMPNEQSSSLPFETAPIWSKWLASMNDYELEFQAMFELVETKSLNVNLCSADANFHNESKNAETPLFNNDNLRKSLNDFSEEATVKRI